jgi:import inner membrane translocase subunit TIM50
VKQSSSADKSLLGAGIAVAGLFGGAGYYWYTLGMPSPEQMWKDFRSSFTERLRDATDPDPAFLANSLQKLPPSQPGMEYTTIFVALEGVLLEKKWDRRYGFRYAKRPHFEEFLMGLSQLHCEIILWSDSQSAMAGEIVQKIVQSTPGQVSLGGLLGKEHTFSNPGHLKGIKRLEHFDRNMNQTMLLDHDATSWEANPDNTILVSELSGTVDSSSSGVEGKDDTLLHILAMVKQYRDERQAGRVANLRSFLRRYTKKPDGTAATAEDVMHNFQASAAAAAEKEMEMRTTGLGGMLRGMHGSTATLKSGIPVTPFNTRGSDAVEGSIMAKKIEAAKRRQAEMQARMAAAQGGKQ